VKFHNQQIYSLEITSLLKDLQFIIIQIYSNEITHACIFNKVLETRTEEIMKAVQEQKKIERQENPIKSTFQDVADSKIFK